MIKFRDLSISRKLLTSSMLTTGTALVVAAGTTFVLQVHFARQTALSDLMVAARTVATHAASSLAARDPATARIMLEALHARSEITEARLSDGSGLELAHFAEPDSLALPAAGLRGIEMRVHGTHLFVSEPVVFEGRDWGRLEIAADIGTNLRSLGMVSGTMLIVVVSGALLIAYLLARRIQRAITTPLFALANTARTVAANNDYTARATRYGNDEIGHLTEAFNHMLTEVHDRDLALRDAQRQLSEQLSSLQREMTERRRAEAELAQIHRDLVDASRRAGQAEVASNVLHNVGNVLNSVIVSSTLIIERLRTSKAANVSLAASLLQDNRGQLGPFFHDELKGKLLLTYLPQLGQELETERAIVLSETLALARNIEHIKQIVGTQQAYSGDAQVHEEINLSDVAENALAIVAEKMEPHGIEVIRNYGETRPLSVDKHRVVQILVNLIRNAAQALEAGRPLHPQLGIETEADSSHARIRVSDNGIGIAAENVTKIFQHGFTTRRDGRGFGLHSGALAAARMGGRLLAESAGLGLGATFTLQLPLHPSIP